MLKRKRIRERGKILLSGYFKSFDRGNSVSLVADPGVSGAGFPKRMQGRTGRVIEKRGSAYVVEVSDYDKIKKFVVRPIHLKKIMEIK